MKRIILCCMMLLLAMGCKKIEPPAKDIFSGVPLETILENIYQEANLELPERDAIPITKENAAYYLGADGVEFTEALASEAHLSVVPFSLCLVRVPDAKKAEETAGMIEVSADPNKWESVSVSSENVIVDHAGDVVILIMAEEAEELHTAFKRLASD